MNAPELLSTALINLASLERHVPKLDRPIYLVAVEQIELARAALVAEAQAPAPYRPRASFQPLFDD